MYFSTMLITGLHNLLTPDRSCQVLPGADKYRYMQISTLSLRLGYCTFIWHLGCNKAGVVD